jgi:hypothetical protein
MCGCLSWSSLALQSLVVIEVAELWGYSAPAFASPFRMGRCRFPSMQSAVLQRSTGSSSRELHAPSEHSRSMPAVLRLPWVLVPSSRRRYTESTNLGERPGSPSFRPQCFAHSRRFSPPVPCRPVSSCCHVQGSRFRGFLPRTSHITSSVMSPLSSLASFACRAHRRQLGVRRPQGLYRFAIRNRLRDG